MQYIYLIIAFLLNASANILLKLGANRGPVLEGGIGELLRGNFYALMGLISFGLNALFYYLALRTLPISIAYPFMVVMSFLVINAVAVFFLGEQLTLIQLIGYSFLVLGLVLIFFFANE